MQRPGPSFRADGHHSALGTICSYRTTTPPTTRLPTSVRTSLATCTEPPEPSQATPSGSDSRPEGSGWWARRRGGGDHRPYSGREAAVARQSVLQIAAGGGAQSAYGTGSPCSGTVRRQHRATRFAAAASWHRVRSGGIVARGSQRERRARSFAAAAPCHAVPSGGIVARSSQWQRRFAAPARCHRRCPLAVSIRARRLHSLLDRRAILGPRLGSPAGLGLLLAELPAGLRSAQQCGRRRHIQAVTFPSLRTRPWHACAPVWPAPRGYGAPGCLCVSPGWGPVCSRRSPSLTPTLTRLLRRHRQRQVFCSFSVRAGAGPCGHRPSAAAHLSSPAACGVPDGHATIQYS
ncbi:hypothetical protein EV644_13067 [Kribbella orskensis]|uniref:Uncharacterized protein n=1 Tax=Kribbella orskensis TaxID=2512216 RepID=A0ABY2B8F5_9ACTN|nr:hypothetical protein EV642_13267 [Kribbella sp. VKM Ac-2500]TCO11625.1 hypothetical protein EV644_13067 [Kribbella orskensis]